MFIEFGSWWFQSLKTVVLVLRLKCCNKLRVLKILKTLYFSFSPLQEAIKHNSFFEPKRKLEQGNVDEAFETVDDIIEGKLQNTFDEKFFVVSIWLWLSAVSAPVPPFFHIVNRPEKTLGHLEDNMTKPSVLLFCYYIQAFCIICS